MSEMRDHYKVLQVDPAADPEVITAAFRALARRVHPDRDASGVHEHRMAELNRAYDVLRDAARRRAYDAERAQGFTAVGPGTETGSRYGGLSARWKAAAQEEPQDDQTRLSFGRYSGQTLREIAAQDAEYLEWLSRHAAGIRYRREIEQILRERAKA
jgi:curved DNA-binding protein CbpA